MQVEQKFLVGIQDTNADFGIGNKALLEAMTNVASIHAGYAGHGATERDQHHAAWVVLNWKLEVFRRPRVFTTFTVRTWAQSCARAQAHRDFEIFDEAGELAGRGTSVWAAFDLRDGSILRMTPDFMDGYQAEPDHVNYPGFRFARPGRISQPAEAETTLTVNRSMIDCNNHVHNPMYLDIAQEVLPEGLEIGAFDDLLVSYKHEIRPAETVAISYYRLPEQPEEDAADGAATRHVIVIRDPADGSLHAEITGW